MKELFEMIKDHTENIWGIIILICVFILIVSTIGMISISVLTLLN